MRTSLICATFVAGLMALGAVTNLPAQRTGPAAAAGIGLIDIGFVFKNHARFKQMMEALDQDVKAAEAKLKSDREQITELAKKLKEYKSGTPPYKKLEEDLTQQQADFTARAQLKQKEFVEREAKIRWTIYQELAAEVKYAAEQSGFSVVLRYNGEPVDSSNPKSVVEGISRPVVYQRGADLTKGVLAELNRRSGGAPPGDAVNPGPASVPRRPTGTAPR